MALDRDKMNELGAKVHECRDQIRELNDKRQEHAGKMLEAILFDRHDPEFVINVKYWLDNFAYRGDRVDMQIYYSESDIDLVKSAGFEVYKQRGIESLRDDRPLIKDGLFLVRVIMDIENGNFL